MYSRSDLMSKQQRNPQNALFQIFDQVPGQLWYALGMGSILVSLGLQIAGQKNWADFVGKWPAAFLAVGLYHQLVRPGNEDAMGEMKHTARTAREKAREVTR